MQQRASQLGLSFDLHGAAGSEPAHHVWGTQHSSSTALLDTFAEAPARSSNDSETFVGVGPPPGHSLTLRSLFLFLVFATESERGSLEGRKGGSPHRAGVSQRGSVDRARKTEPNGLSLDGSHRVRVSRLRSSVDYLSSHSNASEFPKRGASCCHSRAHMLPHTHC